MRNLRLTIPSGTEDVFSLKMRRRQYVLNIAETVYLSFGFEPLHTPVLENAVVFDGHHGEGEKLLFHLNDNTGNPLVLRYDLTVPLARFMGMHPEIQRPFKRYQIAPSFRDDKVDHGHFREFIQCDGDIVGISDLTADAEVIIMADMGLKLIGFPRYVIRVNHRGVINGLAEYACGTNCDILKIQRALDYADKTIKQGVDGVRADLEKRNLEPAEIEKLVSVLCFTGVPSDVLDNAAQVLGGFPNAKKGIDELRIIFDYLDEEVCQNISVDFTLARGADYYTGFIMEGVIPDVPVGAVLGGGRYDNLMRAAGGKSEPAVGMAFGLERILTVMGELSMDANNTNQTVLVFTVDEKLKADAFKVANYLRGNNLMIDFNPNARTLCEAKKYAQQRGYIALCNVCESGIFLVQPFKESLHSFAQEVEKTLASFEK